MLEKEIESQILQWLNLQPGIFAFKVNTVGIFDQRKKVFRKTSPFVMNGTADILACLNIHGVGVFASFEVKSSKGRQSDNQKHFESCVQKVAGNYYVVRSIEDVEAALKTTWKAVMDKVQPVGKKKLEH